MSVNKLISPPGWKTPSGYAHAVSTPAGGRLIEIAGQVGWNPRTNAFEADDFAAQTAQALRNVAEALAAAQARPEHLVRMTWYILDRAEYVAARRALGDAYKQILGRNYPAMSVVCVSGLLEPKARVEIEATAVVPP